MARNFFSQSLFGGCGRTAALLVLSMAFCLRAGAESPKLQNAIIGTWRWVSVNGQAVEQPFYLRYNADGICFSWPVPKNWPNSKGVSHGKYSLANGSLIIDTGSGKLDPKAKVVIKGNQLTMTNEDADQMVYRRVVPALDPGKYEPRKP